MSDSEYLAYLRATLGDVVYLSRAWMQCKGKSKPMHHHVMHVSIYKYSTALWMVIPSLPVTERQTVSKAPNEAEDTAAERRKIIHDLPSFMALKLKKGGTAIQAGRLPRATKLECRNNSALRSKFPHNPVAGFKRRC